MNRSAVRALSAGTLGVALTLGAISTAAAQDDPPDLAARICAAAIIGDVDALLAANLDVQLPAGVRDAVDPASAAGTLDEVKTALGCADEPAPTPTPTGDPGPDEPFYPDCDAAIEAGVAPINRANGEPGYRPELDPDGDGIACEAGETGPTTPGTGPAPTPAPSDDDAQGGGSGFSQLDDVPSTAAETGGGPA